MGDNGPHPKREGVVSGYQTRRCGVGGLCYSGEFSVEDGGSLARRLAWIHWWKGTGTATLEANLDQQILGLAHDYLFQVF